MDNQNQIRRDLEQFNKNVDFNFIIIITLLIISIIIQIINLVHHW